jgi:hypothetical protein
MLCSWQSRREKDHTFAIAVGGLDSKKMLRLAEQQADHEASGTIAGARNVLSLLMSRGGLEPPTR